MSKKIPMADKKKMWWENEFLEVKRNKLFIEQRGGEVDPKWLKADLIEKARELEEALRAA